MGSPIYHEFYPKLVDWEIFIYNARHPQNVGPDTYLGTSDFPLYSDFCGAAFEFEDLLKYASKHHEYSSLNSFSSINLIWQCLMGYDPSGTIDDGALLRYVDNHAVGAFRSLFSPVEVRRLATRLKEIEDAPWLAIYPHWHDQLLWDDPRFFMSGSDCEQYWLSWLHLVSTAERTGRGILITATEG